MNRNHRIGIVHAALALLMLAVVARAGQVQLVRGNYWAEVASWQHFTARDIPAVRGQLFDAGGRTLATSRDLLKLEIAPPEVKDAKKLRRALVAAGVSETVAARAVDRTRKWVVLPGNFVAEDVAALTAMRGVHSTPVSERAYAASPGLRSLIGRVNREGRGIDGLELALDSLLSGVRGASTLSREPGGRFLASPTRPALAARSGHSVTLTINHELQEIAERTLFDAVARMEAEGGDIVILDPRNGEVLAMAGVRDGRASAAATPITEPFEPGSTLKPFIAAGLLARGKARTTDLVPSRDGVYELHGRRINDEPHAGPTPAMLSLADVIRYSSNVGIAQFAERFAPAEQYETLRDFGLGTPTGIPYSAEAAGTLRSPKHWSKQSSASLSMGYEVAVTPLQLALAYEALAYGGELLEPALVKEIRSADGEVRFRHERRVVRRVVSESVAATVRRLLTDVVAGGTAVDADLATFRLAGKTGTPRRTVDGRYAPREYNPNFVGIFPAEDPQLVVVVKMTSPRSSIYGGHTAAPMTKTILEAALAARDAALDRSALMPRRVSAVQAGGPRTPVATATRANNPRREILPDTASRSVLVHLPLSQPVALPLLQPRKVPNVTGMSLRAAVRSLHLAGFRVQLSRDASSTSVTDPPPGAQVLPGTLIRLRYPR